MGDRQAAKRGREQRRLQRGVVQLLRQRPEKLAALARRAYTLPVLLATPSDAAISRRLRPSAYFSRRSSRIFRMDNLIWIDLSNPFRFVPVFLDI